MIVPFVDNGGIVGYHCLNFLFIIIGKFHIIDNFTLKYYQN